MIWDFHLFFSLDDLSMSYLINVVCDFHVHYAMAVDVFTRHEYVLQLIRRSFEKIRYEFISIVILIRVSSCFK